MTSRHWKRTHLDGAHKTTVVHQPHEDRLYVQRENLLEPALVQANEKMRKESPFRKDMFGPGGGRLRWVFTWPDSLTKQEAHARLPDLRSKDADVKMKAYQQLAILYPQYVSQG